MEKPQKLPFYTSYVQIIIGIIATFFVLYLGSDIIVPIVFSLILAILLNPLVNFLTRHKINRVIAIFISLALAIIFVFAILYFIVSQASNFSDALPQLKLKFNALINEIINWISQYFNISKAKINSSILKMENEGLSSSTTVIGQTLTTISGIFVFVFLIPVYIFMILFYKPLLMGFISKLFSKESHETVLDVLKESKSLIQSYLVGLIIEAALVAVLNSVGLMIIGIDYAILLGIIGAILNVIPYIGGVIAIALPVILALATKTPADALFVIIAYIIVQFIDNNVIVPRIVASRVKINALVSIVVVLVGGALWGIPGMFLSIPLTAIIKVVCDRIDSLHPLGYLLGDEMPVEERSLFRVKK